MIRSVNIFKSTNVSFPIRIEFWENDKLIEIREVKSINSITSEEISKFITNQ